MYVVIINEKPVEVPREIESAGTEAIEQFIAENTPPAPAPEEAE